MTDCSSVCFWGCLLKVLVAPVHSSSLFLLYWSCTFYKEAVVVVIAVQGVRWYYLWLFCKLNLLQWFFFDVCVLQRDLVAFWIGSSTVRCLVGLMPERKSDSVFFSQKTQQCLFLFGVPFNFIYLCAYFLWKFIFTIAPIGLRGTAW